MNKGTSQEHANLGLRFRQPMRYAEARRARTRTHTHMHAHTHACVLQGERACAKQGRPQHGRRLSLRGPSTDLHRPLCLPRFQPPDREPQARAEAEEGDVPPGLAMTASAQEGCVWAESDPHVHATRMQAGNRESCGRGLRNKKEETGQGEMATRQGKLRGAVGGRRPSPH